VATTIFEAWYSHLVTDTFYDELGPYVKTHIDRENPFPLDGFSSLLLQAF